MMAIAASMHSTVSPIFSGAMFLQQVAGDRAQTVADPGRGDHDAEQQVLSRLLIGCSRSRKARNKVRNPVISRAPITHRSPCRTLGCQAPEAPLDSPVPAGLDARLAVRARRRWQPPPMSRSPAEESTLGDSRMASTVAPMKIGEAEPQ